MVTHNFLTQHGTWLYVSSLCRLQWNGAFYVENISIKLSLIIRFSSVPHTPK